MAPDPTRLEAVDFLRSVRSTIVAGGSVDEQIARRSKLLRVCDRCDDDYSDLEGLCVAALYPAYLAGTTVCRSCVDEIGFTGCRLDPSGHTLDLFGRADPPDGWMLAPPSWDDLRVGLVAGPGSWRPREIAPV